jgi:hypothetical protein
MGANLGYCLLHAGMGIFVVLSHYLRDPTRKRATPGSVGSGLLRSSNLPSVPQVLVVTAEFTGGKNSLTSSPPPGVPGVDSHLTYLSTGGTGIGCRRHGA